MTVQFWLNNRGPLRDCSGLAVPGNLCGTAVYQAVSYTRLRISPEFFFECLRRTDAPLGTGRAQ